jgi:hypothetical protein
MMNRVAMKTPKPLLTLININEVKDNPIKIPQIATFRDVAVTSSGLIRRTRRTE